MNSWCESCARKSQCYSVDLRPKCYVAITSNDRTADRKTEPKVEAIQMSPRTECISRHYDFSDSHSFDERYGLYQPKTEPQTEDLQDWKDRMWAEAIVTEPQTERSE